LSRTANQIGVGKRYKKAKKYSIIDGFLYVCVSRKCEMMGEKSIFSSIVLAHNYLSE